MHQRQSIKTSTLWENAVTGCTRTPMGMDYSGFYHATTTIARLQRDYGLHRMIDKIYPH